jgi:glycosyltransferase involved in cell wall biosynthesis
MTAYNSGRFIDDQIHSILAQLGNGDELVISVDPSVDDTLTKAQYFADRHPKNPTVRVVTGPGKGVIANFQNAIVHTTGYYIFLSDSDDIWLPDKVEKCVDCLRNNDVYLVMHDAAVVDEHLNVITRSVFKKNRVRLGLMRNVIKNSFMGCCMAFKSNLKGYVLPFPPTVPMHDQWIGMIADYMGEAVLLPEQLLLYRRHDANATKSTHAGLQQMIEWRRNLMNDLRERIEKIDLYDFGDDI